MYESKQWQTQAILTSRAQIDCKYKQPLLLELKNTIKKRFEKTRLKQTVVNASSYCIHKSKP